jgi:ribonuclease HII
MNDKARARRNARERERRRLLRLHKYEDEALARGVPFVGGVDEVGRGPLAGPVVAACVVIDSRLMLDGLDDSKKVAPDVRVTLAERIKSLAVAWAVGVASVEEIARLNIYWASVLAMERAIASLSIAPPYLITDAVRIRSFTGEQLPMIKGDAKCASVAAASIVAKVHRDRMLVELHERFPQYGFNEHKGYATPQHIAALREHGPCSEHRPSFWRVQEALTLFPLEA